MSYNDFWDLSLKEMNIIVETKSEEIEKEANNDLVKIYTLSVNIANFVGLVFNGKQLPSYSELYGSEEDKEDVALQQQILNFKNWTLTKESKTGKAK